MKILDGNGGGQLANGNILVSDRVRWRTGDHAESETFPCVTLNEILQKAIEVETPAWAATGGIVAAATRGRRRQATPRRLPLENTPGSNSCSIFFSYLQKTLMGWNTSWTYLLGAKQAFIDHRRAWMEWKLLCEPIWHHVFPPLDLPVLFERGLSNQVQKYQETKYSLIMIWFDFYLMWEKLHCMANGSHLPR